MKWLFILGITFFNFMDYIYTSVEIGMGVDEANPLVRMFIEMDPSWLFLIKMVFTPMMLAFVLITNFFNVDQKKVNVCLIVVFLIYGAVLIYHIYHTSLL